MNKTKEKCTTFKGTEHYLPPEILNHKEYNRFADIYSLGILLYYMCKFEFPTFLMRDKSFKLIDLKLDLLSENTNKLLRHMLN